VQTYDKDLICAKRCGENLFLFSGYFGKKRHRLIFFERKQLVIKKYLPLHGHAPFICCTVALLRENY
jgi:hypothetical protein